MSKVDGLVKGVVRVVSGAEKNPHIREILAKEGDELVGAIKAGTKHEDWVLNAEKSTALSDDAKKFLKSPEGKAAFEKLTASKALINDLDEAVKLNKFDDVRKLVNDSAMSPEIKTSLEEAITRREELLKAAEPGWLKRNIKPVAIGTGAVASVTGLGLGGYAMWGGPSAVEFKPGQQVQFASGTEAEVIVKTVKELMEGKEKEILKLAGQDKGLFTEKPTVESLTALFKNTPDLLKADHPQAKLIAQIREGLIDHAHYKDNALPQAEEILAMAKNGKRTDIQRGELNNTLANIHGDGTLAIADITKPKDPQAANPTNTGGKTEADKKAEADAAARAVEEKTKLQNAIEKERDPAKLAELQAQLKVITDAEELDKKVKAEQLLAAQKAADHSKAMAAAATAKAAADQAAKDAKNYKGDIFDVGAEGAKDFVRWGKTGATDQISLRAEQTVDAIGTTAGDLWGFTKRSFNAAASNPEGKSWMGIIAGGIGAVIGFKLLDSQISKIPYIGGFLGPVAGIIGAVMAFIAVRKGVHSFTGGSAVQGDGNNTPKNAPGTQPDSSVASQAHKGGAPALVRPGQPPASATLAPTGVQTGINGQHISSDATNPVVSAGTDGRIHTPNTFRFHEWNGTGSGPSIDAIKHGDQDGDGIPDAFQLQPAGGTVGPVMLRRAG